MRAHSPLRIASCNTAQFFLSASQSCNSYVCFCIVLASMLRQFGTADRSATMPSCFLSLSRSPAAYIGLRSRRDIFRYKHKNTWQVSKAREGRKKYKRLVRASTENEASTTSTLRCLPGLLIGNHLVVNFCNASIVSTYEKQTSKEKTCTCNQTRNSSGGG